MPTRTEVLQALRARDELQNRDLAILLDYLEQEAGSSSSTRGAILRSRRRTQDEVTERDITLIFTYLAELGTPAISREVFLQGLRRRDIASIALANWIMDLIDGTGFGPPGAPLYWWDAADLSTLFLERAAPTTNVTANNDRVGYWADKGSAGLDVATVTSDAYRPEYRTDLIGGGGLGFVNFGSPEDSNVNLRATLPATSGPLTAAAVFIRQGADPTPGQSALLDANAGKNGRVRIYPSASDFLSFVLNNSVAVASAFSTQTLNAAYAWDDDVDAIAKGSWDADSGVDTGGSGTSTSADLVIGSTTSAFFFNGGVGEILIYDSVLDAADRIALESYIAGKWGITWSLT